MPINFQKLTALGFPAPGGHTRLIISTSGREASIIRYNTLFRDVLKVDATYVPFESDISGQPIKAADFASAFRSDSLVVGGAISKDIKGAIIAELNWKEGLANTIQSVNTVVRAGQTLFGYNTDAYGFETAVRNGLTRSGTSVNSALIYGNGGVFNVAFHVLREMGIKDIMITARNPEKINLKLAELGQIGLKPYDGGHRDLLINATPVSGSPLENAAAQIFSGAEPVASNFREIMERSGCGVVFDHNLIPAGQTDYLSDFCLKARPPVHWISGQDMYYPQMYRQWSLFLQSVLGREFPEAEVKQLIDRTEEIIRR